MVDTTAIEFSTGTEFGILVAAVVVAAGVGYYVWTRVFSKEKREKIKDKVEDKVDSVKDKIDDLKN